MEVCHLRSFDYSHCLSPTLRHRDVMSVTYLTLERLAELQACGNCSRHLVEVYGSVLQYLGRYCVTD